MKQKVFSNSINPLSSPWIILSLPWGDITHFGRHWSPCTLGQNKCCSAWRNATSAENFLKVMKLPPTKWVSQVRRKAFLETNDDPFYQEMFFPQTMWTSCQMPRVMFFFTFVYIVISSLMSGSEEGKRMKPIKIQPTSMRSFFESVERNEGFLY